jgi:hypothetical protein
MIATLDPPAYGRPLPTTSRPSSLAASMESSYSSVSGMTVVPFSSVHRKGTAVPGFTPPAMPYTASPMEVMESL